MAFRAHDEKSASLHNAHPFFFCFFRIVLYEGPVQLPGRQHNFVVRICIAVRKGDQRIVIPLFSHFLLCKVLAVSPQHDIRTASRHIRCNGNCSIFACLGDDFRFFFMIFRVKYFMLNTLLHQQLAQIFGFFNGNGSDQNRLSFFVGCCYVAEQRFIFSIYGFINGIGVIDSHNRLIRRNYNNVQRVDIVKFAFFRKRRTCHSRKLAIHAEKVLEGDCRLRHAFLFDLDVLFCLDCLVKSFIIASSKHQTARKFIDDDNAVIFNDVVNVALHNAMRLQRLIDVMRNRCVFGIGKIFNSEPLFRLIHAMPGQGGSFCLLVHDKVFRDVIHQVFIVCLFNYQLRKRADKCIGPFIQVAGLGAGAGNDQRRTSLIDQDAVHLIDDRKVELPLYKLIFIYHHVVS